MKKLFLVLFGLFMTSSLSARVIFQMDSILLNNEIRIYHDCFNSNVNNVDYNFYFYDGMELCLGYEFFTDKLDNKFHFFTGVDIGGLEGYISTGIFGGFNYHLFDTEKFRFELSTTVNGGQLSTIKGGCYYFVQTSVDFVGSLPNRRFPYVGIGISNIDTTLLNIYKDFGYNLYIFNTSSFHLVAGIRL